MRLIVLGAPGAGKGTQARVLAKYYNIDHISTGDMLREEMRLGTEIGVSITDLMNKGQLIPDDIIIKLVRERINEESSKNGFIFDGFPRTLAQATVFDNICKELDLKINAAIYVDLDDNIIIERMSGRIVCPYCGAMYHKTNLPPKKDNICDECGNKLVQREDDKAEIVKRRLDIYHENTEPIIHYYREKNMLGEFNGLGKAEEITEKIISYLGGK